MNLYVTGSTIKALREKAKITQQTLAEIIGVSSKTVSKWETGNGYPDITLIEPLAKALNVSASELLSGKTVLNTNLSSNIKRSKFYICPVCGNVLWSVGEAAIFCHGINLLPLIPEAPDEKHNISIQNVEDELFISINHDMSKSHYISFTAAISGNKVQVIKLYPEGNAEARFKRNSVEEIYFYCNKDGLFKIRL